MNCETKKMVLPCKLFEQTITNEEFDAETNQLITNDEQNKNAQKLEFKNISYGYQKYESKKEVSKILYGIFSKVSFANAHSFSIDYFGQIILTISVFSQFQK